MTATIRKSLFAALASGVLAVGLVVPAMAQDVTETESDTAVVSEDTTTEDGAVDDHDCPEHEDSDSADVETEGVSDTV